MNSKTLIFLLVAALVYGIFVIAHNQFDKPFDPNFASQEQEVDVSDLLRPLLDEGQAAFQYVRSQLQDRHDGSEALLPYLPRNDEPWIARVEALLKNPPQAPYGRIELAISEPRGVETGGQLGIILRREQPGLAWLRLLNEDQSLITEFEVPVNQRLGFPEGVVCEAGKVYRLELCAKESGAVVDRSIFGILSPEQLTDLQKAMQILKRFVADQRLRFFLQASCAMSRGLNAEATEILLRRMPRAELGSAEVGLMERLLFLYDRRAEFVHRDGLIKSLSER